jgi:hypothetical protein
MHACCLPGSVCQGGELSVAGCCRWESAAVAKLEAEYQSGLFLPGEHVASLVQKHACARAAGRFDARPVPLDVPVGHRSLTLEVSTGKSVLHSFLGDLCFTPS